MHTSENVVPGPQLDYSQHQSELYKIGGQIGLELQMTQQKIEELRKIAKKKSVFDDKSAQADKLMAEIKEVGRIIMIKSQRGDPPHQDRHYYHTQQAP